MASSLTKSGTAGAPVTKSCARTVRSPITIEPMPSVMISGWTPKMPIPMPLTSADRRRPTASAIRIATTVPREDCPAMMYAAAVAVKPTERSMPPVSITSVWPAARIASGAASRRIVPACSPDR